MTTVINNPGENGNDSSGAAGVLIGALIVVLVLVVGLVIAWPYIRQQLGYETKPQPSNSNSTINVTVPTPSVTTGSSTNY